MTTRIEYLISNNQDNQELRFPYNSVYSFLLGNTSYRVLRRLDRDYGIAERYLAESESGGEKVCLSRFIGKTRDTTALRRGGSLELYAIYFGKKAFLSEYETLIKLAEAEKNSGTSFFPRIRSKLYGAETYQPAFVMDYIDGVPISQCTMEKAESLKNQFIKAMSIAHTAGIHFADLRVEDLIVDPSGKVHIIDFNSTEYYSKGINPEEADFARLDDIYNRLKNQI